MTSPSDRLATLPEYEGAFIGWKILISRVGTRFPRRNFLENLEHCPLLLERIGKFESTWARGIVMPDEVPGKNSRFVVEFGYLRFYVLIRCETYLFVEANEHQYVDIYVAGVGVFRAQ